MVVDQLNLVLGGGESEILFTGHPLHRIFINLVLILFSPKNALSNSTERLAV